MQINVIFGALYYFFCFLLVRIPTTITLFKLQRQEKMIADLPLMETPLERFGWRVFELCLFGIAKSCAKNRKTVTLLRKTERESLTCKLAQVRCLLPLPTFLHCSFPFCFLFGLA